MKHDFTLYLNNEPVSKHLQDNPKEAVRDAAEDHAEILHYDYGWTIEQFETEGPTMVFRAVSDERKNKGTVLAIANVVINRGLITKWYRRRETVKKAWLKHQEFMANKELNQFVNSLP